MAILRAPYPPIEVPLMPRVARDLDAAALLVLGHSNSAEKLDMCAYSDVVVPP
jgi:hypothetical protein